MAGVRTKQLAIAQITTGGGSTDLYTVPASRRTIVKELRFWNETMVAGYTVAWRVYLPGTGYLNFAQLATQAGVNGGWVVPCYLVLEAGQTLNFYKGTGGTVNVVASGVELVLP